MESKDKVIEALNEKINELSKDLVIYSSAIVSNESMTRAILEKLSHLNSALYWYNKVL